MNNDAHSDQPRDNGKFSFRKSPEGMVRLAHDGTLQPVLPVMEKLMRFYNSGPHKESPRAQATLKLLEEAAKKSSTDKEPAHHLSQGHVDASNAAYDAKRKKVSLLDVPGRIRRRREVREANVKVDSAGWASGLVAFEIKQAAGATK
jgi:hypothetical protein